MNVGFLLCGDVNFGCVDVEFWLGGRWIFVDGMLNFGCVDVGFWLGGF